MGEWAEGAGRMERFFTRHDPRPATHDPRPPMSPISDLLFLYDQSFSGRAWHGPTLWGSLRGMGVDEALARPRPGRHNAWEVVLHCAYWKWEIRRRLTGDPAMTFPRDGANFPDLPAAPTETAWRRDRALLKREHLALRQVIAAIAPARLPKRAGKSRWTVRESVVGIACHDVYHAGQIRLVRMMVG